MARQDPFGMKWKLPDGAETARIFYADVDDAEFLLEVDAGLRLPPWLEIPRDAPQQLDLADADLPIGRYQFAVVARNNTLGKSADPYQHIDWVGIPLDPTPLAPAFGGEFGPL